MNDNDFCPYAYAKNYTGDIAGDNADVLAKHSTASHSHSHSTSVSSMAPTTQPTSFDGTDRGIEHCKLSRTAI